MNVETSTQIPIAEEQLTVTDAKIKDEVQMPVVEETDKHAEEFTSEIYKIELKNLPKNFGFGALKRFIASLDLKIVKLKSPPGNCSFAFVTFTCEEERQKALKVLNEATLKGKKLTACVSFTISLSLYFLTKYLYKK